VSLRQLEEAVKAVLVKLDCYRVKRTPRKKKGNADAASPFSVALKLASAPEVRRASSAASTPWLSR
jgi:hypothetical protein